MQFFKAPPCNQRHILPSLRPSQIPARPAPATPGNASTTALIRADSTPKKRNTPAVIVIGLRPPSSPRSHKKIVTCVAQLNLPPAPFLNRTDCQFWLLSKCLHRLAARRATCRPPLPLSKLRFGPWGGSGTTCGRSNIRSHHRGRTTSYAQRGADTDLWTARGICWAEGQRPRPRAACSQIARAARCVGRYQKCSRSVIFQRSDDLALGDSAVPAHSFSTVLSPSARHVGAQRGTLVRLGGNWREGVARIITDRESRNAHAVVHLRSLPTHPPCLLLRTATTRTAMRGAARAPSSSRSTYPPSLTSPPSLRRPPCPSPSSPPLPASAVPDAATAPPRRSLDTCAGLIAGQRNKSRGLPSRASARGTFRLPPIESTEPDRPPVSK